MICYIFVLNVVFWCHGTFLLHPHVLSYLVMYLYLVICWLLLFNSYCFIVFVCTNILFFVTASPIALDSHSYFVSSISSGCLRHGRVGCGARGLVSCVYLSNLGNNTVFVSAVYFLLLFVFEKSSIKQIGYQVPTLCRKMTILILAYQFSSCSLWLHGFNV